VDTPISRLIEDKGNRIVSISPDASVLEAAQKMRDEKIGAIMVMKNDALVGIMSERDIMNRVVAVEKDPAATLVQEVMTTRVSVISPRITVRDAMQIVTEKHLRHMPIVQNGELMGMLSSGDLTRSIVSEEEEYIETLFEYISGSYPS
jgi:CBS domain-containing protein